MSKINYVENVGAKTDENIAQTDVGQYNDRKALKAKYPFENEYSEDVDVRHSNADYRSCYNVDEVRNVGQHVERLQIKKRDR